MKKRKILGCILVLCMVITISTPAFGADTDSASLEKAIVYVKEIISIPAEYTDFTYSSSEYDLNDSKVKVWKLSWNDLEKNKGQISVSIDEYGNLIKYDKYDADNNSKILAKITKSEGEEVAEKFLQKVVPNYAKNMKNIDYNFNNGSDSEYYYKFEEFANDIPVDFISFNIGVNKQTGEVTSLSELEPQNKTFVYPVADGIIEKQEAEKAYINNINLQLKYYSSYDYKQKKINVFAAYSLDPNESKAINAKNGEVVNLYRPIYVNSKGDSGFSEKSTADASVNNELTKEEVEAINNISGLITKEKAEGIIRGNIDGIASDEKVANASLTKENIDDKYIWKITFDSAYGQVDARTGELLSFYYYNEKGNKNISKNEAQNIAENFLKKVSPLKFNQTKYDDSDYILYNKSLESDDNGQYYLFNYNRIVNGIEFVNNSLNVRVNMTTGKIVEYNSNWYDNITFPDISGVMNKENAFNKIDEMVNFALEYNRISKDEIALIYNFRDLNERYLLDPIKGIRLDYNGQPYKDKSTPNYNDISGTACEKTVKALLENGYYITGDKFNPNSNITQINFLKYLYSPVQNYYNDDEFYEMLISNGVIKKEEKSPNSIITNKEAAKLIVRYLGYDKVAQNPEIFKSSFNDEIDLKYVGYVSICYGLGIMKGDKSGKFNGNRYMTNAKAAEAIYNLLIQNEK